MARCSRKQVEAFTGRLLFAISAPQRFELSGHPFNDDNEVMERQNLPLFGLRRPIYPPAHSYISLTLIPASASCSTWYELQNICDCWCRKYLIHTMGSSTSTKKDFLTCSDFLLLDAAMSAMRDDLHETAFR